MWSFSFCASFLAVPLRLKGEVEGPPVACRSEANPPISVSPSCLKRGLLASHASFLLLISSLSTYSECISAREGRGGRRSGVGLTLVPQAEPAQLTRDHFRPSEACFVPLPHLSLHRVGHTHFPVSGALPAPNAVSPLIPCWVPIPDSYFPKNHMETLTFRTDRKQPVKMSLAWGARAGWGLPGRPENQGRALVSVPGGSNQTRKCLQSGRSWSAHRPWGWPLPWKRVRMCGVSSFPSGGG